jgi:hypothetical protein
MTIMLDEQTIDAPSAPLNTLADALDLAQGKISGTGRIIVTVHVDGEELSGQQISNGSSFSIVDRTVRLGTADQKQLSLTLLGKIHALVEFLGRQQIDVAGAIEKGQQAVALKQLAEVLGAWQQIHAAYSGLVNMSRLDLAALQVGQRSGQEVIQQFSQQLREIADALSNKDMVMLADILQYEMDSAIQNWNDLLAATLGAIDPDAAGR